MASIALGLEEQCTGSALADSHCVGFEKPFKSFTNISHDGPVFAPTILSGKPERDPAEIG